MLSPQRHLPAYDSTNKYTPVPNCKASRTTANSPIEFVCFFCATPTMLMMTAAVTAIELVFQRELSNSVFFANFAGVLCVLCG